MLSRVSSQEVTNPNEIVTDAPGTCILDPRSTRSIKLSAKTAPKMQKRAVEPQIVGNVCRLVTAGFILIATGQNLAAQVLTWTTQIRITRQHACHSCSLSGASARYVAVHGGDDGRSEVFNFDSPTTEPAVPLKVAVKVRVLAKHAIEITAIVSKRSGYPADLFFDRDVRAQITLLPGLELEEGSLSWSGDLRGNQVAEFVAKVKPAQDTEGIIETTAIGHGMGDRIDADKVRFHISVRGDQIRVSPEPHATISPLQPGTGAPVK